jgi:hypothetical protein
MPKWTIRVNQHPYDLAKGDPQPIYDIEIILNRAVIPIDAPVYINQPPSNSYGEPGSCGTPDCLLYMK